MDQKTYWLSVVPQKLQALRDFQFCSLYAKIKED